MDVNNVRTLLACLGVGPGEVRGQWVNASCPLAFARHEHGTDHRPSFGVRIDPQGRSGYFCFACQLRSRDLADLLLELSYALRQGTPCPDMNLALAQQIISSENEIGYTPVEWSIDPVEQVFEEFPEWWLDSFPTVFKFPEAMAYLNRRGVPKALWTALDLRYDTSRRMVCFPFYNLSGKLAGMRGRSITTSTSYLHHDYSWNHYNNTKLTLMGENRIDWNKPVVIVEGEFDYCRVFQVYSNVVANLTTALSPHRLTTLELAMAIIGFWDSDEAGALASLKMQQRFGSAYTAVVYPEAREKLDPAMLPLRIIEKILAPCREVGYRAVRWKAS